METKRRKARYRIRNWKAYNEALVKRGRIDVWIDDEIQDAWYADKKSGRRGASSTYSDLSIQCGLTFKEVFHLPLRATEGFLTSLLELLGLPLSSPDYTTLCRRRQILEVCITRGGFEGPRHIVVDSTGLKIYGEGEWKVRQHGYSKRRTWRKLHLAVDESSHDIVAVETTANSVIDSEVLPNLLDQVEDPINQVSADGAYDTKGCYAAIQNKDARAAIPPRENAVEWPVESGDLPHQRNQIMEEIEKKGRKEWKKESGYHRRSIAETAMFRYKTIFGDRLTARLPDSQIAESYIRCAALNRMTALGMPDSYRVNK